MLETKTPKIRGKLAGNDYMGVCGVGGCIVCVWGVWGGGHLYGWWGALKLFSGGSGGDRGV